MNRYLYSKFKRPPTINRFEVGDFVSLVAESGKFAMIYEITPEGRYYLGGLDGSAAKIPRSKWHAWSEGSLLLEKPRNGEWMKHE
jgi:hypothetical protein